MTNSSPVPPGRKALAARGRPIRYSQRNTVIIQEGALDDSVFVILAGRVKVFSTDAEAREIVYGELGPWDYFGEMSLDGSPRSASVVTMEPTECSVVSKAEVRRHMAENPDFAFELLEVAIGRAREATRIARGLALDDVYSRLRHFLEREAVAGPDGARMLPRMTQQDIAARIGSGREIVARQLKDLEAGGIIARHDRRIVLLKPLPARW
jgi:CRP/FNR family cyclic AMP-dependent transcriptional regulator